MMRFFRLPFLLAVTLLVAGCRGDRSDPASNDPLLSRELTPAEYQLLSDRDKIRYKNIVVRVPDTWGGAMLPFDIGPYRSGLDKAIHTGDLNTLMGFYNQSAFELEHPRVKVEFLSFDMWANNFNSALAVALSAHRAPAYYVARNLPQTIEQGMYPDHLRRLYEIIFLQTDEEGERDREPAEKELEQQARQRKHPGG